MAQLENQRYGAGLRLLGVAQKMPAGHALNDVAVGSPYSFHSLIATTCLHTWRWRRAHEALLLQALTAPCSTEKITQTAACRGRLSFFLFFFSFCRAPSVRGQPFIAVAVAGIGERFRAGTDEHCCGASFVAYAQCRNLSAVRWGKERAAQAMRHLALRDALPVHLH
jgi:hypothetical protein